MAFGSRFPSPERKLRSDPDWTPDGGFQPAPPEPCGVPAPDAPACGGKPKLPEGCAGGGAAEPDTPAAFRGLPPVSGLSPLVPIRDWAIFMIWSIASGLERRLFSLSSNSAMRPDLLSVYLFTLLLMRSSRAAPSGLWATRLTRSAMILVLPCMAACTAR